MDFISHFLQNTRPARQTRATMAGSASDQLMVSCAAVLWGTEVKLVPVSFLDIHFYCLVRRMVFCLWLTNG